MLLEATWTSPIRVYTIQAPPKGHVPVGEVFGASPSGAVLTVEATRARISLIENAESYLRLFGFDADGAVIVGLTTTVTPMGSVMAVLVSGTLCVPQGALAGGSRPTG